MIGRVFQPGHAEKKGAVQPVAPQQLLWLWVLWVQLWVLGTLTFPCGVGVLAICHSVTHGESQILDFVLE